MDYLDPKTEFRHRIILLSGYALLAIAIVIASLVLLKLAYGFGLKNGTVNQNGLTFFSSQPQGADINISGLSQKTTNRRLYLPEGTYHVKLTRTGYYDWQRTIELSGGSVVHFDYPFLFPREVSVKKIPPIYSSAPGLVTQSPDRRWLLIQQADSMTAFELYDLKNLTKPPTPLSLPANLLTKATKSEAWQLDEWADDNQHVVLQHNYDGKTEFILVDKTAIDQSLNLNTSLSLNPTKLTLIDKKYDRYYVYDGSAATLQIAGLKTTTPIPLLTHILAYQSYSDDTLLYATDSGESAGKIQVRLKIGNRISTLRSLPVASTYLLDLTKYSNTLYVAVGASSLNKIYIYRDPIGQIDALPDHVVSPVQILHVEQPNYLSFSTNAQFIVAESGTHFGVYDLENKVGYNYTTRQVLDAPQTHASWMDGDRLVFVSAGKLNVFDYDGTNMQALTAASSNYLSAFTPDFKAVYSLNSSGGTNAGQFELTQTLLRAAQDR